MWSSYRPGHGKINVQKTVFGECCHDQTGRGEGKAAGEAENGSSKVCPVKDLFHFILKTHGPCQRKGYKTAGITLFKEARSESLCCAGLLSLPCFFFSLRK